MNKRREAKARATYKARTGRDDWDEFMKLSPLARLKMLRNPPVDGLCDLHIEQNMSRAGGLGTTDALRWHWWITAPDGRIVHSDYQLSMKLSDRAARQWATKHSIQLK
ncbi:hypothetical protein GCM10023235_35110 [Kitasatospora terrestris]|uniref:Uncharacterized protein n=1 Tax=Kitasatospora terrestris TaxID=258051 RepID=A0ABP9DSK1_9ACTN